MKKCSKLLFLVALAATAVCGLTSIRFCEIEAEQTLAEVPADYYSSCEGKEGSELQAQLLEINAPKSKSYDWSRYEAADEALDDSSSVLSLYTRHKIAKGNHVGGSYAWDKWNREHIWTQTKYPNSDDDNHNIFACEGQINGYRGNMPFGEVAHTSANQKDIFGHKTDCYWTKSYFEPCDEAKGEVARSVMYGTVMYTYNMTEEIQSIELALKWHLEHPIAERDTRRNDVVYGLQGNRNPFVDHPEYACKIWGNTNQNTKKLCGSQPTPTKKLIDLTYTGTPVKTEYTEGDSFNPNGLIVTAKFDDNTTSNVTNLLTWSKLNVGDTSVTGTYTFDGVTKSITVPNITVNEKIIHVTGVTLNKNNLQLEVGCTGTLTPTIAPSDATNKHVTWSSSNDTVATVSNGIVTAVSAGDAVITVESVDGNKTATCNVKVSAVVPVDIEVVELPRTSYHIGEAFDKTGMKVELHYSNGTSEDITASVRVSEPDMTTSGEKLVDVTYLDFKKSFTITVLDKAVVRLILKKTPAKVQYYANEKFNSYGAVIEAVLDDESVIPNVTDQCSFEYDFGKDSFVHYSFGGVSNYFSVVILSGEPTVEHKAADFAYAFNEKLDGIEVKDITLEEWDSLKYDYNKLDTESKDYLKNVKAATDNGEVTAEVPNEEALRNFAAKYDKIYLAHKSEGFSDYIGRNPKAANDPQGPNYILIISIVAACVVVIALVAIIVPVSVHKSKQKKANKNA